MRLFVTQPTATRSDKAPQIFLCIILSVPTLILIGRVPESVLLIVVGAVSGAVIKYVDFCNQDVQGSPKANKSI